MISDSPSCRHLRERWCTRLFSAEIFPSHPFRQEHWIGLAFNRDKQGLLRLPLNVWQSLLDCIAAGTQDRNGFILSPHAITGGEVQQQPQPFVISLDERSVVNHFTDDAFYLPSFFMAGASERWAVWGDSDLTVIGGEVGIAQPIMEALGGESAAISAMCREFDVCDMDDSAGEMNRFLRRLVRRS